MASQLESTSRQVFYSTRGGKLSYIYSGRGGKASSLRASIKQRRASHPLFVSSRFARVNCRFLAANPVIKPVSISTSFLGKRAGQSFTSCSSGCLFISSAKIIPSIWSVFLSPYCWSHLVKVCNRKIQHSILFEFSLEWSLLPGQF